MNLATIIWVSMRENLSLGFVNNKSADRPAHPSSMISAFVVRLLESTISRPATSESSIFYLVTVAVETHFG